MMVDIITLTRIRINCADKQCKSAFYTERRNFFGSEMNFYISRNLPLIDEEVIRFAKKSCCLSQAAKKMRQKPVAADYPVGNA
jgi:hypothetical protein